jgi:hypothetical protein
MSNGGEVSTAGSREPIRYPTVLVVEGRDTFGFFLALLRELGLHNQVEVRNAGGITDLPAYLRTLTAISGFDAVTSLGVARDSEADPAAAFREVCSALRHASLPVPPAALQPSPPPDLPCVWALLLPDEASPGMLETLCWRALASHPLVPCIDELLACVLRQTGQPVKNPDKSRIYAYIAAREEPWFLLGQAARSGYLPWASSAFDQVKKFVQDLAAPPP